MMGAPRKLGGQLPPTYTANFLACPPTGFRVYFPDEDNKSVMRNLWYASLEQAKQGRARLCLGPSAIIVGHDGTVI